ncbi:unnamed protein product [Leptosia nina]|uniref:Uncharacterized protein n=1 Tax=Leptosia nina TaxID=320188 RepID=A0AAV1K161_9NEOP
MTYELLKINCMDDGDEPDSPTVFCVVWSLSIHSACRDMQTLNIEGTIVKSPITSIAPGDAWCQIFTCRFSLSSAENQPPNNPLTPEKQDRPARLIKHHRTVSLPAGCSVFQEPLKIAHGRTRSEPLTGDEVDQAILEKTAMHSSCKTVNGIDTVKKNPWCRRASTGTRFSKLSPAHTKSMYLASTNRHRIAYTNVISLLIPPRCPMLECCAGLSLSSFCSCACVRMIFCLCSYFVVSLDVATLRNRCETMPSRATSSFESDRPATSRHVDVIDGVASSRDDMDSLSEWYRTPRIPEEPDCCEYMLPRDFMSLRTGGSVAHSRTSSMGVDDGACEREIGETVPDGYLPMGPTHVSSSGSVCSGTPSTDPRFSEYQLEPATAHIAEERSTRAYSVGSRPVTRTERVEPARLRAYSAGARRRPVIHTHAHGPTHPPRATTDDLMEIDFSANSPQTKVSVASTPPTSRYPETPKSKSNIDEYVDMSPRNAGYVEMKPGEPPTPTPAPATDGYVEMSYSRNPRIPTRPIAIANPRAPPPTSSSPETREIKMLHGSQTIFPFSPDSPASPPELDAHALSTVREISEEGRKSPARGRTEVSSSPQYVTLARPDALNNNKTARIDENRETDSGPGGRLHYAALDLEARTPPAPPPPRLYTQIDFARSETFATDAL